MITPSISKKTALIVLLLAMIAVLEPVIAKEVGCAYCTSSCSQCKPTGSDKVSDSDSGSGSGSSGSGSSGSSGPSDAEKAESYAKTQETQVTNDYQTYEKHNEDVDESTAINTGDNLKEVTNENNIKTTKGIAGDPVLVSSGRYVLETEDINIPGSGFSVTRKYLSEESAIGSMGTGWMVSLDSRIIRNITVIDQIKLNEMEKLLEKMEKAHKSINDNYSKARTIANRIENNYLIPANTVFENWINIQLRANLLSELNLYSDFPGMPEYHKGAGNENLVFIDEDGTPFVFEPSGDGIWLPVHYPQRDFMRLESLDGSGADNTDGFKLSERGGRKKYYNGYGLLTKVEELNGSAAEIVRNDHQKILLIKGPHGNEWQVTYDGNFINKITGPENTAVEFKYDGDELKWAQDADGDTAVYAYENGRLRQIQKPDGSAIELQYGLETGGMRLVTRTTHEENASESFSYYPDLMMTIYTNHSGVQTRYYYDSNHRTVREEHSDGNVNLFIYNDKNQLETEIINGFRIGYRYDFRGNLARKEYGDNTYESLEWNINDQIKKYTDRDGVVTRREYDARGNCTEIYRAAELIFTGSYDSRNLLKTVREGSRAQADFAYNAQDLPKSRSVKINNQTLTESWEYDKLGRVIKYKDASEREWKYSYFLKETVEITPEGLTRRYVYNNRKDLVLIEETDNKTKEVRKQEIGYDRRHLPLWVKDGAGIITNYQYRADGQIIRRQSGLWYIEYGYENGSGRVNNVTRGKTGSSDVYTESYGYMRQGWNEERTISINGAGTSAYQFNAFNQVTGVRNAMGELSTRTVNGSGNPVKEQGASGGFYSYEYDLLGRVTKAGRDGETAVIVNYNRDGSISKKTDRLGNDTFYEYDGRGLLIREYASPGEYKYYYDAAGRLIRKETISRNNTVYYTDWNYSSDNRAITVTSGGMYKETLYLNAWGETIRYVDGEGNERRYEYNGAGKLVKSFDGYSKATQYAWNEIGKIAAITYPDGTVERYEYDHLGNVTEIKDAIGVSWNGKYDKAGRLIKETGRPGIEKEYKYDALGRITEVKNGLETVEEYRYTNRGREVVFKDGAGSSFTQQKNQYGELVNETNRVGDTQRFSYDKEGKLTAISAYSGKQTITELNEAEGSTTTKYSDGTMNRIIRDFAGNIIRAENETGIIQYKYDAGGRLIEQNDTGAGEITKYTYDRAGRRVRMQSGNRDVQYRYGSNGELLRVYDISQRLEVNYEYDARSREIKRQYGNGVWQETIYDAIGRVIMIRELNSRNQLLRAEGYLYDEKGRRSHNVDEEGRVTMYIYDNQSRLSGVLYPWTNEKSEADRKEASEAGLFFTQDKGTGERHTLNSSELYALREILNKAGPSRGNAVNSSQIVWRETYTYDRNGNRSGKTTPWGTIRYEYDAENRLVRKGDIVYTNDKDGNVLTEKGIRTEANYQYNGRNRMSYSEITSHTEKTNSVTSYRYDALGRRTITENVNGQMLRSVYDGGSFEVIREGDTFRDGSLTTQNISNGIASYGNRLQSNQPTGERYRWISDGINSRTVSENGYTVQEGRYNLRGITLYGNGEAVAASYNSSTGSKSIYLGKDLLGSVRSTTAVSGALEDRYEYDAFGQPYSGDLSSVMNLGYTGKPYDTVTGLYNYGYRDYKPQTARFTTLDPIRDGNNWFAYVNNDPVNWVDLWGLEYVSVFSIEQRAWNLMVAQTKTRTADMYQQGGGGRYPSGASSPYATFCNQSTFDIADATGFNSEALYNGKNRDNINANTATQNLALAAIDGIVLQVDGCKAQEFANKGFTVIAAWENSNGASGHLTTVVPSYPSNVNYAEDYNPWVSNVGTANYIMKANIAFAGNTPTYYFDPNQIFEKYDLSGVAKRQEQHNGKDK